MSERRLLPTITVLEYRPPELDIITYYELLFGLPNIFSAFIGGNNGEARNGVWFDYGEGGFVIKNYPDQADTALIDGDLHIITDSVINDAQYYYLDDDGYLRYFFKDAVFDPTTITGFLWGLDFTDENSMSLDVGNEINSITQFGQVGTWSSSGASRPIWNGQGAVFDGINDYLNASFLYSGDSEVFMVVDILDGIDDSNLKWLMAQGNTGIPDGDMFALIDQNGFLSTHQSITGQVYYPGDLPIPLNQFNLLHWRTFDPRNQKVNGFNDNSFLGNSRDWSFGTPNVLTLGRTPRSLSVQYSSFVIKELLFFNAGLNSEDRKDIEAYLKYKHGIPVYVNSN